MIALRECSCGATAYTQEDLELFCKQTECKYGRSNRCKKCQSIIASDSYKRNKHKSYPSSAERRREMKRLAVELKGGKCANCGIEYNGENAVIFDFHHLDPTQKDFSISNKRRLTDEVIAELNKCVLLCSNCHRMEHKA